MADDDKKVGFQEGNEEWVKSLPVRRVQNVAELRKMFRRMSGKAAKVAWQSLDSPDERIRLTAAQLILDRGWGKPTNIDPEKAEDLAQAHLEALRAIGAGASADVVTPADQERMRRDLAKLPKLSGIRVQDVPSDVEDINDINDLDDDQVNDDLNKDDSTE